MDDGDPGRLPMENALVLFSAGGRPVETALRDLSDEELIARSQAGEESAFGEFVARHMPAVHRWMARAVGEQDSDDMTQEIFIRAYRGLSQFRSQAPPRAWLAAIADNAVKNRYRSRSRFRRIFAVEAAPEALEGAIAPARDPERNAEAGESRDSVLEALQRLPAEFRLPVVLRDLEDWSYEEIALSLRLPLGTVKSRIARGRGQLRVILAPLVRAEKKTP
jgi:RNA polymerase sigma-70 factor (ECF subfamily)